MKLEALINSKLSRLEFEYNQLREKQLRSNDRNIIITSQEKREALNSKIKLLKVQYERIVSN